MACLAFLCTILVLTIPPTVAQTQVQGNQGDSGKQSQVSQAQDLRFGRGRGPCWRAWPNPDPEPVVELQGIVTDVDLGAGRRFPSFTLDDEATIFAGPFRAWMESGFELSPQDTVMVRVFPSPAIEKAWVAIQITKPDGCTLVLRDESGRPRSGWGRRGW